jgi:N-acetylmuramoyl-L-alanine amidase
MAILDFRTSPHNGRVRLLPDNRTAARIAPRLFILHSIVGSLEGAYSHFLNNTSLESTFGVRLDGFIEQWMDTERVAHANADANGFANSVETEDNGDPDSQPWTNAQLTSLEWLANELMRLHPAIRRQRANMWDGSGIGYHTMFPEWVGTPRTCPGAIRKRQFNEILLPSILLPDTDLEDDEMSAADAEQGINMWFGGKPIIEGQKTPGGTLLVAADHARKASQQGLITNELLAAILDKIGQIDGRITALEQKGNDEQDHA